MEAMPVKNKAALERAVCCSLSATRDAECTWPQGHMKQITGCFSCDTLRGLLHSRTAFCRASSFLRLSTLSCSFLSRCKYLFIKHSVSLITVKRFQISIHFFLVRPIQFNTSNMTALLKCCFTILFCHIYSLLINSGYSGDHS